MGARDDVTDELRKDFRERLELFYAQLQLAPPYDSVEKAVGVLVVRLKAMPAEDRRALAADPSRRWAIYREAFIASGLNRKHRGIIAGLIRSGRAAGLPREYGAFLDTYAAPQVE